MKILVTGATGFVGSELTRQLLDDGADVRILRRATSRLDLLGDAAGAVDHAVGDVTDPQSLLPAFEDVELVYHTAAYLGFGGRNDRRLLYAVNVGGTANVVNAALKCGVRRLVHTSSMAAFGRPERAGQTIDERAEWHSSRANTEYATSKHEAELEIHRGIAEGLDAVMVNPALIFGVGRPGENTRELAEKVRDGKLPGVPAGGTNVVDVKDVAAGHLRAMQDGGTGQRYFLGSENLSWREIIDALAEAFGVRSPRVTLPPWLMTGIATAAEVVAGVTRTKPLITREMARQSASYYRYDHRRAVDELGCTFRPFEDTARRIAREIG